MHDEKNKNAIGQDSEIAAVLEKENAFLRNLIKNTIRQLQRHLNDDGVNSLRFETIFDESAFGNVIIDRRLKILRVNDALTKILGYDEVDLLGKRITDFAHRKHKHTWRKLQDKLKKEEPVSFSMDTCMLKDDGTGIWCHVTSITFTAEGETFGYTIIEDVTERKDQEKFKDEAETRKDEFLSMLSHELKTPLSTIKALNQLLAKKIAHTEKHYSFVERSLHQIQRLERLIDDLLDVARINSGKMDLTISRFRFTDALYQSISGVQQISPRHEVVLESSADIDYVGDRYRIEQVMVNLIGNAVKYSPQGGKVLVKSQVENESIIVSIEDFGTGIAEKDMHKLFKRFYRIDKTAMMHQGLGLGLYITSEILKKHNGDFWIKSEEGKGSTFSFSLPIHTFQE